MKTRVFEINDPGPQTTIQDLGRYGFQNIGVPVSGPMDSFSFKAANTLLNNPLNFACLETTFLGPKLTAIDNAIIAVTGAKSLVKLNEKQIQLWQPIEISKGDIISFESPEQGIINYLSVKGGFDSPLIMGSHSTYLTGKFGGQEGRILKTGDVLFKGTNSNDEYIKTSFLTGFDFVIPSNPLELRILISNSLNKFSRESIARLWESTYTISSNSNRIGYRLNGPSINHNGGADIISSGTEFGAIQIPGNGQPIILMADRGTTGGYSKIGSVISPDISKLAQAGPNHKINFRPVSLNEAHLILFSYEKAIKSLASTVSGQDSNIRIMYDNKDFEINLNSGKKITDSNKIKEHSEVDFQKYKIEYNGKIYDLSIETYL